jgi:hypothetical protein
MEKSNYHAALKLMHEAGVNRAYYHGWASGVLGNPLLEEQRVTDAYTAGFEHGQEGDLDGYKAWLTAKET